MVDTVAGSNDVQKGEEFDTLRINAVAEKFLADLTKERDRLVSEFPLCALLIEEAFERVYTTGRVPGTEFFADVYKQKPIKVTEKVFLPVKQYPKFNFIGKLLGPKGNSLRRLQEESQCKIFIKGRGSIRDAEKEEELRQTSDPRHAHLHRDLFVKISAVAPPAEAHARIAFALSEIRKYIVPDKNDDVSQDQIRELMEIDPESAKSFSKTVLSKYSTGADSKFFRFIKGNLAEEHDNEYSMEEREEGEEYKNRFKRREGISPYGRAPSKRNFTGFNGFGFKRTPETLSEARQPVYK